jgi:hypothetical protein
MKVDTWQLITHGCQKTDGIVTTGGRHPRDAVTGRWQRKHHHCLEWIWFRLPLFLIWQGNQPDVSVFVCVWVVKHQEA